MSIKVAVFGTGYVGLVSGVCIADFGINVTCVDVDQQKIESLQRGEIPIYEPGLETFLERNIKAQRINFTTESQKAIESCDVLIIAVGTPPTEDGQADLSYVYQVANSIGEFINGYKVIVNKSTVPIGTGKKVKEIINNKLKERKKNLEFDVVSNPEFLREGKALQDFTHPDRVVIGVESIRAEEIMKKVYRSLFINETPFVVTNVETAELIKYASNAFLATKITFINEIANLCEKVGADVKQVAKAMGKDGRIGSKFLHAGPGFGGSCFPKDIKALVHIAKEYDIEMSIVKSVITANDYQKKIVSIKLEKELGTLEDKKIGILGIAFKAETDDIRESPAISIIEDLIAKGANVRAYDPQALDEAKHVLTKFGEKVVFGKHAYDTAEGVDALVVVTDWNEFRNMDMALLNKIMSTPVFYDARNIYNRKDMEAIGFRYIGTGI